MVVKESKHRALFLLTCGWETSIVVPSYRWRVFARSTDRTLLFLTFSNIALSHPFIPDVWLQRSRYHALSLLTCGCKQSNYRALWLSRFNGVNTFCKLAFVCPHAPNMFQEQRTELSRPFILDEWLQKTNYRALVRMM